MTANKHPASSRDASWLIRCEARRSRCARYRHCSGTSGSILPGGSGHGDSLHDGMGAPRSRSRSRFRRQSVRTARAEPGGRRDTVQARARQSHPRGVGSLQVGQRGLARRDGGHVDRRPDHTERTRGGPDVAHAHHQHMAPLIKYKKCILQ